jgi:hypothetical protein
MFRELGYGVLFFLSAGVGAALAAAVVYRLETTVFDFPEFAAVSAVRATPYGAALGSVAWLIFKRLVLTPQITN